MTMRSFTLFFCLFLGSKLVFGQNASLLDSIPVGNDPEKKLELSCYGSINFHHFDWQIWPEKRDEVDFERAVLDGKYRFAPHFSLNAELEIEHGGTGVAVEFDRFEEFGEFEYEVEKGGEIRFEKFNLQYDFSKKHHFQAGYVKVPFGMLNFRDEPDEYPTISLPVMENTLLPVGWAEFGLLFRGNHGRFHYFLAAVNALDGSAFSSANFIKNGNQRRFETVNANDWAAVGRLDYSFGQEKNIGFSGYFGNTRNNRPKPDLQVDAFLSMADFHVLYEKAPFEFCGQVFFGNLQNSEAVSNANRNLSNNLNVKRTPVAKNAVGYSAEIAFELFDVLKKYPNGELNVFARYDYFDSMASTEGQVFNNPRWERSVYSGGITFQLVPQLVLKSQFTAEKLGISTNAWQRTVSVGMGFHFR